MYHKSVTIWLWIGVVMIFVQIVLGGITRLTGSGLSITKWDIVTGTIPPLDASDWEEEFGLYQETPQYQKINEGMLLAEFKFIYFWEYVHRLWARTIGIVFIIPFIVFVFKKSLDARLFKNLGIAVLLGIVVAAFGWIMVASGLVERPWVNAYKLTMHLNLALLLYAWLVWIAIGEAIRKYQSPELKKWLYVLTGFIIIQFLFGGLMSGMKAGLYYPTWPDMHGELFPKVLIDNDLWTTTSLIEYEKGLVPGLVQFVHRMCAYCIFILSTILYWKARRNSIPSHVKSPVQVLLVIVILQIILGVLTVIHSVGRTPLFYGVAHQAMAILLLSNLIYIHRKIHR